MISIERHETIHDVPAAEWDSLAGDDVFASRGWLRTLEETSRVARRPLYVTVRGPDGLLGAAACRRERASGTPSAIDTLALGRLAGRARRLRLGVSPALVCGTRHGIGGHVLTRPGASPDERRRIVELVLGAMEDAARAEGLAVCFRNVAAESPLGGALRARGYARAAELPQTVLDVAWSSLEEYVRDLRTVHPRTARNVRRELDRTRRSGLVFGTLGDPGPLQDRLHDLLDGHYRRLNGRPFPFGRAFPRALHANLGGRAVTYVALDGAEPIAVSIGLRAGDALFLSLIGVDGARQRDTGVYFLNGYDEPIRHAIASGIRRIYGGKLVYDLKLRRGYRLLELDAYVRPADRLRRALLAPVLLGQPRLMRRSLAREHAVRP